MQKQECGARVVRSDLDRISMPAGLKPGQVVSFLEIRSRPDCPYDGLGYVGKGYSAKEAEANALEGIKADRDLVCIFTNEPLATRLASQGVVSNPGSRSENL
jgi:hypothetical protein